MTTVEFANHLSLHCAFDDPGEAPVAQAQELALVMTQAMERWFELAPAHYRRTTVTQRQPAMETLEIEIANGSSDTIGAPFPLTDRGSTIFVGSDPRPNEITSPSTLLYPYAGDGGTVSATIYHNCIAFPDFLVERVVTHPEVVTAMGNIYQMTPLAAGSRTFRLPAAPGEFAAPGDFRVWANRAATPTHYWLEAIGGSHQVEHDGVFQLRVWPLPTSEFMVQMDAEILPLAYRVADLVAPSVLPVPDSLSHRTLIPLARGILADSPIFDLERHGGSIPQLRGAGERAETQIRNLAGTWIPTEQRGGTPRGW